MFSRCPFIFPKYTIKVFLDTISLDFLRISLNHCCLNLWKTWKINISFLGGSWNSDCNIVLRRSNKYLTNKQNKSFFNNNDIHVWPLTAPWKYFAFHFHLQFRIVKEKCLFSRNGHQFHVHNVKANADVTEVELFEVVLPSKISLLSAC